MGRNLKVYSGGTARVMWNGRPMSVGEGIWVLSKTGGTPHVSAGGAEMVTPDVVSLPHDMPAYPEAYLGQVHHRDWALAYRAPDGLELEQVRGAPIAALGNSGTTRTNWWPAAGGMPSAQTAVRTAVMLWNFRYGRYNSPQRFADRISSGEYEQMNVPAWAEALPEDDFPEAIAISKARSKETGLQWTRRWYQWGHSDCDDFLIVENAVENTGSEPAVGVYIVFQNRFISGAALSWRGQTGMRLIPHPWARDDHARSTVAPNYLEGVSREAFLAGAGKPAGLPLAREMAEEGHAMLYAHDGESDHVTNLIQDVGDPYRYYQARQRYINEQAWIREGHIQHGQYFGIGVVDAFSPFMRYGGVDDDVFINPHDNPDTPIDESRKQPASVTIWNFHTLTEFEHPTPTQDAPAEIYDVLTRAGWPDEPEAAYSYTHFMTFGPYTLQPGEKCKVVVAYVGGMGGNDPKYDDYKRYPEPFNLGWMNLFGGTGHQPVAFDERQREIPLGDDAMFRHFQRAIDVYTWGYDIPNQPPNIKLSWHSDLDAHNVLTWSAFGEDAEDPDYQGIEAQDLRGYRIYRTPVQSQGPWEFVTEFSLEDVQNGTFPRHVTFDPNGVYHTNPDATHLEGIPLRENKYFSGMDPNAGNLIKGLYSFTDVRSLAGFGVHYSVRYYDSGHSDWNGKGMSIPVLESAPGPSGGAIVGGKDGITPVVPGMAVFDRLEARVKVVPNPWKANDDQHTYLRKQDLRFTNIPGRCQIDIYDVAGQRVWTFFHGNPDQAEVTYLQFTENRPSAFGQSMYSGIYFWKVTSLMPGSEGKVQKGTFMIIK